ncbi:hypothetical protein [Polyangium sp. 6x1]|uniref:hypothetical protein n=1 Tax=Polyangium sp. 6x1 TaxID=3042689 RepID=UPI002482797A|nr:hypothetical protein [Polyangium sp. 6x1]MDI1449848.1 hypothetical protein [Polyangium sp. 6x1]
MRSPLFAFLLLLAGCTGSAASPTSPPVARTDVPPPPPPKPVGWSHAYCTSLWPWAVAVGADDHIAVSGLLEGKCDLGGFHLETPRQAGFLAWFDADGAVTGARTFSAGPMDHASIVAAPGGDWVVAGHFLGTLDLGAGALPANNKTDAFLARLDASGAVRWQKQFSGAEEQHIYDVAVTPAGEIAIVGTYRDGALDLGTGPMPARGLNDIFVASFTQDGAPRWAKSYGDDKEQWATSIAVDATGGIAIGGSVESPLDLGDGVVAEDARSPKIGWVAKLDPKGRALWARAFASIIHHHRINDLAMGPDGGVVVAGFVGGVEGQVALGDTILEGAGLFADAFVASLDASGATRFFSLAGTPGSRDLSQYARDVVVARSGEILVYGPHEVTTDEGKTLRRDEGAYFQTFDSRGTALPPRVVRGVADAAVGHATALDSRGRLVTVGVFKGSLDFGMGATATTPGRHEFSMFLAALVP